MDFHFLSRDRNSGAAASGSDKAAGLAFAFLCRSRSEQKTGQILKGQTMIKTLSELTKQHIATAAVMPMQLDTPAAKRDASGAATKTRFSKLSILIPAYNEEATLHVCLQAV